MADNPIDKGRLIWMGKSTVPLTFVHTSELAAYAAPVTDPKSRPRCPRAPAPRPLGHTQAPRDQRHS